MPSLKCIIKVQKEVIDLVQSRNSFSFLHDKVPDLSKTTTWKRGDLVSNDLQIIVIGKSGYGKSTMLNTIVGQNVFETNDIEGCTRAMQSAEYRFEINNEYCNFSMADLPGIGESPTLDKEYINLYRSAIDKAHVAIYILRADQRDYSIDHWAFSELFKTFSEKSKVIVAINAVDKVEPLNRQIPFALSNTQKLNMERKIKDVCSLFDISQQQVIGLSAIEDYNVDQLIRLIGDKLAEYLVPKLSR